MVNALNNSRCNKSRVFPLSAFGIYFFLTRSPLSVCYFSATMWNQQRRRKKDEKRKKNTKWIKYSQRAIHLKWTERWNSPSQKTVTEFQIEKLWRRTENSNRIEQRKMRIRDKFFLPFLHYHFFSWIIFFFLLQKRFNNPLISPVLNYCSVCFHSVYMLKKSTKKKKKKWK